MTSNKQKHSPSAQSAKIEIEHPPANPRSSLSNEAFVSQGMTRTPKEDSNFGEVFRVRVGPTRQVFTIHIEHLERIPYLNACYDTHDHGSEAGCMDFPDDEPSIFQGIVHYVYFDIIPNFSAVKSQTQEDDEYSTIMLSYLLATKLQMEELGNKLVDSIHCFHGKTVGATVKELITIEANEAPGGPLKRLLMRSLAEDIVDCGWQAYFDDDPEMKAFISESTSRSMQLGEAICDHLTLPSFEVDDNLCQWHTHERTPRCKPAE